jgi:hypothetical protein
MLCTPPLRTVTPCRDQLVICGCTRLPTHDNRWLGFHDVSYLVVLLKYINTREFSTHHRAVNKPLCEDIQYNDVRSLPWWHHRPARHPIPERWPQQTVTSVEPFINVNCPHLTSELYTFACPNAVSLAASWPWHCLRDSRLCVTHRATESSIHEHNLS